MIHDKSWTLDLTKKWIIGSVPLDCLDYSLVKRLTLCTFAVDEAADDNNSDPALLALAGVWSEVCGVHSVGNNRHYFWV